MIENSPAIENSSPEETVATNRGLDEVSSPHNGAGPSAPVDGAVQRVEERINRLEDGLASLQDTLAVVQVSLGTVQDSLSRMANTDKLEERIAERVAQQQRSESKSSGKIQEKAAKIADAGKRLIPAAAAGLLRASAAAAVQGGSAAEPTSVSSAPRVIWEAYTELLWMIRMFFDRQYRLSWMAWVIPICAVSLMFSSWLLLDGWLFVGTLLDKLIDLILAFFVYKVLIRETKIYRESLSQESATAKK